MSADILDQLRQVVLLSSEQPFTSSLLSVLSGVTLNPLNTKLAGSRSELCEALQRSFSRVAQNDSAWVNHSILFCHQPVKLLLFEIPVVIFLIMICLSCDYPSRSPTPQPEVHFFTLIFLCLFLDIIWEVRRKGKTRYKPLTQAECQALEDDYQVKKNLRGFYLFWLIKCPSLVHNN